MPPSNPCLLQGQPWDTMAADPEVFPWTALGIAPVALLMLVNHEDRLQSRLSI